MTRATGSRPPPAGGRRAIRTGTGILLITVGAILRFAVAAGSPLGLNVHIVGVILMVVGVVGLLLPRLAGSAPLHRDRLRRWVRPHQPRAYDAPPTGGDPAVSGDRPALVQDRPAPGGEPTLVDDLLNYEHHPLP
jgi:hypothetical protein